MIIPEKAKEKRKGPTERTEKSKLNAKVKRKIINSNESENTYNTRRKIKIIGDSILHRISEFGLRRKHNLKVRPHPWASMQDIKDHIRPVIRQKQTV